MIIGICGFIGSGKDTIADFLVSHHGYRRESFASTLKDAVASVFGWDRIMLEGTTKASRVWREQEDEWWSERLGIKVTPRLVLQLWGTDVCRKAYHDDIWIASLENKLRKIEDDIVISDCRFPNEIQAIKNLGGEVIRVIRGAEPAWYEKAIDCNAGMKKIGWSIAKMVLEDQGIHASEYAWVGTDFDHILDNNSTLDNLHQQVNDLVQGHRAAKGNH